MSPSPSSAEVVPCEALEVVGEVLHGLLGGGGVDDGVVGAGQEDGGVQHGQQEGVDAEFGRDEGEDRGALGHLRLGRFVAHVSLRPPRG